MVLEGFRQRLGAVIGGFDAAQMHRRLRGFRASRAHVNTLIAGAGETITARARWLETVRNFVPWRLLLHHGKAVFEHDGELTFDGMPLAHRALPFD